MTEAAPWWGVPVIAGSFLLLGGVLGFVFALIQTWLKHRREDQTQYRSMVLEIVLEVFDALQFIKKATKTYSYTAAQKEKLVSDVNDRYEAAMKRAKVLQLMYNVSDLWRRAELALLSHRDMATSQFAGISRTGQKPYGEPEQNTEKLLKSARKVLGIR